MVREATCKTSEPRKFIPSTRGDPSARGKTRNKKRAFSCSTKQVDGFNLSGSVQKPAGSRLVHGWSQPRIQTFRMPIDPVAENCAITTANRVLR